MHNLLKHKGLRTIRTRNARRSGGFSLAELIVSMGILLVMLTLAGQVMSLTVRATGQANAVTEVNQSLRIFERTIRNDLKHVKPEESLILIEGNPINAYLTAEGQEADDNSDPSDGFPPQDEMPRADVLMFFTVRRAVNYVQYDYAGAQPNAGRSIVSGVQQVLYGHANLVEYDATGEPDGPIPAFPTDPTTPWLTPAEEWHLSRRIVHLLDLTEPAPNATPAWVDAEGGVDEDGLAHPALLRGESDVITHFNYNDWVLKPYTNVSVGNAPLFWPQIFIDKDFPPHARSVLDETPPPRFANRLGHYCLPHCVSFKVEWALDRKSAYVGGLLDNEKEIFWFDPGAEQPLGDMYELYDDSGNTDTEQVDALTTLLNDMRGDNGQYNLLHRFGGGDSFEIEWHSHEFTDGTRPNLHVFTAGRLDSDGNEIDEDIFPVALRITIDLMDRNKRLERPKRHVMIVPVGR